jgi:hypothetical protein
MLGYIITPDGQDAIDAFADPAVRFAAVLEGGAGGFVAFEGDASDVYRMTYKTRGRVLTAEAERPDRPSWLPFCPKRQIGTGAECFYLVPVTTRPATEVIDGLVAAFPSISGVAAVSGNQAIGDQGVYVLVESQGPISLGGEWAARVTTILDKRAEAAAIA